MQLANLGCRRYTSLATSFGAFRDYAFTIGIGLGEAEKPEQHVVLRMFGNKRAFPLVSLNEILCGE